MTEVWFYHLEKTTLIRALSELLDKIVQKNWRAYVHCPDLNLRQSLDEQLWLEGDDRFLGHSQAGGNFDKLQPVLLGSDTDLGRDVFVSVAPYDLPDLQAFKRCLILFENHSEVHLLWARALWSDCKARAFNLAYWRQSQSGQWEKKQ
jgi:DNA polymerase III subunit chi